MAHLSFVDHNGIARQHSLLGPDTTIGRHPERELQLLDHSVQEFHATVSERRGVFLLEAHALVQIGGSFVWPIAPTALRDGDVIAIGEKTLGFHLPRLSPHSGTPEHLQMLPMGLAVPILRLEHTLAAERVHACVRDALALGQGSVLESGTTSVEIVCWEVGQALVTGLALVRALRKLAGPADELRLGADLAPLDQAREGAELAMSASHGYLVATDSFLGRALIEAQGIALSSGDVLFSRLAPAEAGTNLPLYTIACN